MCATVISPVPMSNTEDRPPWAVLHEDDFLLVLNKPPGSPVQDDRTGSPSVERLLHESRPGVAWGLPHRLDRPVSGVLLIAKDRRTLTTLGEAFRTGRVAKTYWAIVEGTPAESGEVTGRAVQDGRRHRAFITDRQGNGREVAITYRRLVQGERYALLEVRPQGGAFHQIRALLAHAKLPIRGDVKYGARRGERGQHAAARSIALHARSIACDHPVQGSPVVFEAPPPQVPLWGTFIALLDRARS